MPDGVVIDLGGQALHERMKRWRRQENWSVFACGFGVAQLVFLVINGLVDQVSAVFNHRLRAPVRRRADRPGLAARFGCRPCC